MFKKTFILLLFPLFLFSCEELNEVSEELKILKSNQDLILKQQADLIKKLASLESAVKSNSKPNTKKNNKRKTPNPNISHNIPIGNSIVLGNPNAKVTVTKFTDFQ